MASSENQTAEPPKELAHKTKLIQFLGRTTPIILQNDNGPCPLLAICNVLLLKNNLNLSPDADEVSQENLLSLVAERLIDSNSNVDNKDAGYVENQQQNIADAIDLLPRLTTGIDVNIKFRRIDDFEFTRECAIFDLLDIPLYHGWIVDPQDYDTVHAIGLKSYNTLMGDLVGLETQNAGSECKKNSEEDCVDFVAATTAALGVPSPCLPRGLSFDEAPGSVSEHHEARKGDLEEEAELLKALKLSEANFPTSSEKVLAGSNHGHNMFTHTNESAYLEKSEPVVPIEVSEGNTGVGSQKSCQQEPSISNNSNDTANYNNDLITFETVSTKDVCLSLKIDQENSICQSNCEVAGESDVYNHVVGKTSIDEATISDTCGPAPLSTSASTCNSEGAEQVKEQPMVISGIHEGEDNHSTPEKLDIACPSTADTKLNLPDGSRQNTDGHESFTSSADDSEPIYEGEEHILESGTTAYEDREPMYEGEVVLAEQVDGNSRNACDMGSKNELTPEQGQLIKNFLMSSASQLTVYGLFSLQDGLKERELCVFFRNNHFNTMFKFNGELYILATDQGYINQPDLVWEKLNEVNGDTLFVTGNFKEFKVENHESNHASNTWDEQNARATTADYLASIDNPAQDNSSFSSDMQLAIALQQQEFEQQSQRNSPQPTVNDGSRLVIGPQVSRSSGHNLPPPSRPESKSSKEKCVVM